jgi:anthranilate synthase component 2
MVLVIDNYDSFTYNLVQYLGELGADVRVFRNDRITLAGIERLKPDSLVISPGPCTPTEAGVSVAVVQEFAGRFPILGVCLGHQSIASAFGGSVIHAQQVMHGKTSTIHHDGAGVYQGIENPLVATRYHSLVVSQEDLPECLYESSWTLGEDGEHEEIMGLRHREYPVEGVQFHPESILTPTGRELLGNFIGAGSR